jgi:hypothetical protein
VSTLVLQITFTDADVGDTVAITMPTDTYFDLVDNGDDTGKLKFSCILCQVINKNHFIRIVLY